MKSNFELRKHILNLMDKNLEIRQSIYMPIKETSFEKIFLHIERFFLNIKEFLKVVNVRKSKLYPEK